ncbi:MAG: 4Fe-4S binding protein [Betaproteobacteria bacterium]|nr:4Fe-4S binding protein [Betaproteobacteria bacterium]MDE2423120.1 4Fe-4S binding protein [Betaproteobacteria bacterium]
MANLALAPNHYHLRRRAAQALSVLLVVLIPALGIFRIDPIAGAMVVLGRQIWFSDFFLVAGLWILVVCMLVMLYSIAGTVFCGWVCPQNIMAEWANFMTHKLLGKRAEVSLEGDAPLVAPNKNKALNWTLLGLSFLLAAMFFALIPLFYFYPPQVVWDFLAWQSNPKLARSLHWIYAVVVIIIFIDIAIIRHFWCRFACVYRVWQHSFKTRETLHIKYDDSRASECLKCNYCVTACFIDLDPKKTDIYDSCINCGECIDACNKLHAKKNEPGLLTFEMGERKEKKESRIQFKNAAIALDTRTRWVLVIALMGLSFFVWGLISWEPYHLAVYKAEGLKNATSRDYQISVANKQYKEGLVTLSVEGVTPDQYHLDETQVLVPASARHSLILSLSPKITHGIHRVIVVAKSTQGWEERFPIQYFSEQ